MYIHVYMKSYRNIILYHFILSHSTPANPRIKILDLGGFDSSVIIISRGGILRSTWGFPGKVESTKQVSVWRISVWRLTVSGPLGRHVNCMKLATCGFVIIPFWHVTFVLTFWPTQWVLTPEYLLPLPVFGVSIPRVNIEPHNFKTGRSYKTPLGGARTVVVQTAVMAQYVYIYIYRERERCMCTYIYIYTYIERERHIYTHMHIYMYIYIYIHVCRVPRFISQLAARCKEVICICVYIYIYISIEREREKFVCRVQLFISQLVARCEEVNTIDTKTLYIYIYIYIYSVHWWFWQSEKYGKHVFISHMVHYIV